MCALNAIAALKSVVGDLDQVAGIVKVVGFVASDPSFTGQPQVVNGASELLGEIDQHVAAEDHVERAEMGEVLQQIELAELHHRADVGIELPELADLA